VGIGFHIYAVSLITLALFVLLTKSEMRAMLRQGAKILGNLKR
jgi:hypothetical protein